MVKPAHAQSIPTPSVPEFTVKFVNASYEVPTSYSTDPYTGQNVTHSSYFVENSSIELTITNQPFVSLLIISTVQPWNISLFYNVRMKGHYSENWTTLYSPDYWYPTQSNSDYTVMTFLVVLSQYSQSGFDIESYYAQASSYHPTLTGIPANAKIDFQVEAMIGYLSRIYDPYNFNPWTFTGQTSDWSNTQTITISASPNPTPTPTVPEFPTYVILPLFFFAVLTNVIYARKKITSNKNRIHTIF